MFYFFFEDGFAAQYVVVVLGEAVGFVADVLEEAQAGVVAGEADGFGAGLGVDEFFLFGEGDDHGGFDVHGFEDVHGGVELAEAAVDEDDVGEEFVAGAGFAVSAGDDFLDAEVVVVALAVLYFVAAIGIFEGDAVDEADF